VESDVKLRWQNEVKAGVPVPTSSLTEAGALKSNKRAAERLKTSTLCDGLATHRDNKSEINPWMIVNKTWLLRRVQSDKTKQSVRTGMYALTFPYPSPGVDNNCPSSASHAG